MSTSTAALNQMLATLSSTAAPSLQANYVSLHTADPGTTGANEVAGGSYARQAITWSAPTSADLRSSNAPVFNVPGSTTITHFGLWTAASGGTYITGGPLSSSQTYSSAGTYTLSQADVTGS
jgi:hypothetical protein